jgi:hypothetical protein
MPPGGQPQCDLLEGLASATPSRTSPETAHPRCGRGASYSRSQLFVLLALTLLSPCPARAVDAPARTQTAPDPGWPRRYSDGSAKLVIHQPQVESWKDFKKLKARFATELTPFKGSKTVYGAMLLEADTAVDPDTRTVGLVNFDVMDAPYPSAESPEQAKEWAELTRKLLPERPTSLALDRILAYLDSSQIKLRSIQASMESPPILVSTQPAVLVMIDGKPVPVDIEKTNLQKIVNTNWDLFFDKKNGQFYLRDGKLWLTAKSLQDSWKPITKAIKEFSKLPATAEYQHVKLAAASPQKPSSFPLVLVADKPTELIWLSGEPVMEPITGTRLMWVSNTESDLFFDTDEQYFYFLTSGRWFRNASLKSGRWQAATTLLPEDFRRIPTSHRRAHVLVSVPGTRQAEEAVLAASIPQTAALERASAKAQVQYVGEPKFEPIAGSNVSYAVNTPNDVLKSADHYYLCLQGAWFVANAASGPWELAEAVPEEIYKIPPDSPKHHVTYVTVYESSPTTVTYGYTSGYSGVYISYGVAMWGTGYYYPPYYGWGMYPYPVYWPYPYYTYGASAWYNPVTGTYARGSAVYGPYGGYSRAAAYNPATGAYAWGRSAWGPYGAAASGGFYNPTTGRWGGTYHASNGYQSWGQSVVGRGDQWARTASYADSRGAVGALQTSAGGKAIAARGSEGQGFVGKSAAGDIYAGRDGNVYRRDQSSGQWYRNEGGSWQSVDRPTTASSRQGRAGATEGLNRDAAARQSGNYNARRSEAARQSSRTSAGSWSSSGRSMGRAGGGGWSSRGGGFGRRR